MPPTPDLCARTVHLTIPQLLTPFKKILFLTKLSHNCHKPSTKNTMGLWVNVFHMLTAARVDMRCLTTRSPLSKRACVCAQTTKRRADLVLKKRKAHAAAGARWITTPPSPFSPPPLSPRACYTFPWSALLSSFRRCR